MYSKNSHVAAAATVGLERKKRSLKDVQNKNNKTFCGTFR